MQMEGHTPTESQTLATHSFLEINFDQGKMGIVDFPENRKKRRKNYFEYCQDFSRQCQGNKKNL